MKWLAWCSDDGDRNDAKLIATGHQDACDVASAFAERSYSSDPFDKYRDVSVVCVSADGTETTHEFTVDVEFFPAFSARPR